ncbi:unnamed protein product [Effrenium voratum]|nr:unnamed protein product [Effrenium voratum]
MENSPARAMRPEAKQKIQTLFEKFDTSGDGVLSEEEMGQLFRALHFKKGFELMKQADANKDGVIQVHEFISWLFEQKPRWKLETIVEGDEKRMQATFFNDFKETKFFAIFASGTNVEPWDTLPATCVVPAGESRTINFLRGKLNSKYCYRVRFRSHCPDAQDEMSFVDSEFPPEDKSVDPTGEFKIRKPELWVRARYACSSEACLFDQICPQDVKQGKLGDCWLMGSLGALAQYPQRIKSLFDTNQLTEDGKYGVWLFDLATDKWTKYLIDELLPCYKDRDGFPIVTFARPLANEVWVSLLEKAVAKYCGGYRHLVGGQPAFAFRLFTGEQGISYVMRDDGTFRRRRMNPKENPYRPRPKWIWRKGKFLSPEEFFETLCEHASNKHVLTCSAAVKKGRNKSEWKEKGLVTYHIYSILRVLKENLDDGTPIRLVEARNPWAWGEWKGDWCDSGSKKGESGKWAENPQLRERVLGKGGVDGAFFMCFEDWVHYFTNVSVCPVGTAPIEEDGEMEEGSDEEDEYEDVDDGP